ncbi:MAG: hypothetical protein RR840_03910 [Clostridium sp.]
MRDEIFNKIIADLKNTPFEELFKKNTSKEVNEIIYNEFINLGCKKDEILKHCADIIPVEYVNIHKINQDSKSKEMFDYFESIINKAFKVSKKQVIEIMYEFEEYLNNASDKFMVNYSLEADKNNDDLYEFCTIIFEEMGKLLEATIKPYLSIYLALIKVIENKYTSFSEIRCKTLGGLIFEIEENKMYRKNIVYRDSIYNIKLSDIRNICKHEEYIVVGNEVICKYGKNLSKEIRTNKEQIINVFLECENKLVCMRVPLTIFIMSKLSSYVRDSGIHINEIRKSNDNDGTRYIDEIFYSLVYLLSQGYMTIDIKQQSNVLKLLLKDLANEDVKWRTSYLMAYLFGCYVNLAKGYKYIDITYLDYKGDKYLDLLIDCTKHSEVEDIEDFISKAQIKKYVND